MQLQRTKTIASLTALLLLALPLSALAGEGESCSPDSDCGACAMGAGDIASLLDNYLEGNLPDSYCEGTTETHIAYAHEMPAAFFAQLIMGREDRSEIVRSMVERFGDRSTKGTGRAQLLDLAVRLKGQISPAVVQDLWETDRRAFSMEHMVALAEGAPDELTAAIEKAAKREVLPAAYLALRGDDRGTKVLRRAVKRMDVRKGAAEGAMAAVALSALGDEKALGVVRARFEDAALSALDQGDLESARHLVLEAEFLCKRLVQSGKRADLHRLSEHAQWYARERSEELASADDIFSLLEELHG